MNEIPTSGRPTLRRGEEVSPSRVRTARMLVVLLLLTDLAVADPVQSPCALDRKLLAALDRYCATAAPSEQHSCQIMRSRFRACSSGAFDQDDGVFLEVHDDRIRDGICLHLNFTRLKNGGFWLDHFSKAKDVCECECCP
jgi:hypothetical protein